MGKVYSVGKVMVKNSQELDRFFTLLRQQHSGGQAGFHFGHEKRSFRNLNKVKFQGFFGVCI
jgi:hypothetical protein